MAVLASIAGAQPAAYGWTPQSQVAIATEAARLAPPDLERQIERHVAEFRRGVLDPFHDADPGRHMKNPDGTGSLDAAIFAEADRAVAMIRGHHPFAGVVFELGRLAHFLADADNPLNASQADDYEGRYFADYLRYMETARPRFALVFYGFEASSGRVKRLPTLVESALARGRKLYPLVGEEYRRTGRIAGAEEFDDRSTAFAIAALSFNHALTDVAAALRDVWIRGGGADPRPGLGEENARLVLLGPGAGAGR